MSMLNRSASVKTGLKYCPLYNSQVSCCSPKFERAQMFSFNNVRDSVFMSKLARVAVHLQSVAALEHTKFFRIASADERKQYKSVLESFSFVLHPHVHSDCMSGLLTYTAGVLCFACKPDWDKYVTMEAGAVVRLHVDPSVCAELWSRCEVFGQVASDLKESLGASALAQRAKRKAESLDMFFHKQSLCGWVHKEVALKPFRKPSVEDWEPGVASAEIAKPMESTCEANETDEAGSCLNSERILNESNSTEHYFNVFLEGERSGFKVKWNQPDLQMPGGGGNMPFWMFEAMIAVCLLTVFLACQSIAHG